MLNSPKQKLIMPKEFEQGLKEAFGEVIGGIIHSTLLKGFVSSGLLSPSFAFLIQFLGLLGTVGILLTIPSSGIGYVIGWYFGIFLLMDRGLLTIVDLILYLGFPLIGYVLKLYSTS